MGDINREHQEEVQEESLKVNWKYKPRTKGKVKADYTLKSLYPLYMKEIGNKAKNSDNKSERLLFIDYKRWIQIQTFYLKLIMNKILDESAQFEVPYGGKIYVQKKKMNISLLNKKSGAQQLRPDWKASREFKFKKLVFHLNTHSDGNSYRISWFKKRTNKSPYCFKACRANNRRLAQLIINNTVDYWN